MRMLLNPLLIKHPDVLSNVTELRNDRILNRYKIMKKSEKSGGKVWADKRKVQRG